MFKHASVWGWACVSFSFTYMCEVCFAVLLSCLSLGHIVLCNVICWPLNQSHGLFWVHQTHDSDQSRAQRQMKPALARLVNVVGRRTCVRVLDLRGCWHESRSHAVCPRAHALSPTYWSAKCFPNISALFLRMLLKSPALWEICDN